MGDSPTAHANAIPTNMIMYKSRKMPARIDPEARVAYVIEMMASAFGTKEHHITLCLRDEQDGLVTQHNLLAKVQDHESLKLVQGPTTDALAVAESLKVYASQSSVEGSTVALPEFQNVLPLKLALFNFQKYIKEEEFAVEFMLKGGVRTLVRLLERSHGGLTGNSLAYALQGIRGVLEFESGWGDLSDTFIDRVLSLLMSATQPNILRPATAITRKLVISSPQLQTSISAQATTPFHGKGKGKDKGKGKERVTAEESVNRYGFDRVYARMEAVGSQMEEDNGMAGRALLFRVIVKRLESAGDLELVSQSLGLINACLRSSNQEHSRYYHELITILEGLSIRRYISRLMPTCVNNTVEPQILNFQARYATILNHLRQRSVRPAQHPEQERMLSDIWRAGRLGVSDPDNRRFSEDQGTSERSWEGWRKIGLTVEEEDGEGEAPFLMEVDLFRDTGELGLECLHWFAMHDEHFHNIVVEQNAKPPDRRCPLGKTSAECVKILCEHYKVSQAGHHPPAAFQVFLLNFPRLHSLVVKFFMRMWQESESRLSDFSRVSLLVRSQIRLSLADEASKSWLHLERDFLETDYRTIRDRQMETLEKEDGMLVKDSVRELRGKLHLEAQEVVNEQRIGCMLQGAWFNTALVNVQGITTSVKAQSAKPLRFLRLSPNRRSLAWADYPSRQSANPTYESLRERIDLSNVTDIRLKTGCAVNSRSQNLASKLSFSLMSGPELSLMDVDAVHAAQLAEWTDGLRVLISKGKETVVTQESANFVHILTELALKVRLLDMTGDGVELPDKVTFGAAPKSSDFWFAK